MEEIVGELVVKKIWRSWSWRKMGKASSSIKVAALILFSLAAVTGEPILMVMTTHDMDDDDWIQKIKSCLTELRFPRW